MNSKFAVLSSVFMFIMSAIIPAGAATVITTTLAGNVPGATAVDNVVVNGTTYDVTFATYGPTATTPADLTFLGDPAGALNALNQIDGALQAANIEEFVYTDLSAAQTHTANNFVIISNPCVMLCAAPYSGDEGNRTTNGSPWLWAGSSSVGIVDGDVFAIFGPTMTPSVPELSTWAMMLLGFFGVGFLAACTTPLGSPVGRPSAEPDANNPQVRHSELSRIFCRPIDATSLERRSVPV